MRRAFAIKWGILLLAMLHIGCASRMPSLPLSDEAAYLEQHTPEYQKAAKRFVGYAQKGDVSGMISQTSPITLRKGGKETVTKGYEAVIVPRFKGNSVTWDKEHSVTQDEFRNPGILFSGTIHSKPSQQFYFPVFRENGKLVVPSIWKGSPNERFSNPHLKIAE